MALDSEAVQRSLTFDPQRVLGLQQQWQALMLITVWGKLESSKLGAMPRLRKRVLETGENLVSLFANRDWISQPHQQLKSALGTSVKLRDSLLSLERSAVLVEKGEDFPGFEQTLMAFRHDIVALLEEYEAAWAELLESQLDEPEDDEV